VIEIPVGEVTRNGLNPQETVTADGSEDLYAPSNDGNILILAENLGGSDAWVDFVAAATVAGVNFSNTRVTIPAGERRWVGTFPPVIYTDSVGRLGVEVETGSTIRLSGLRI